MFDTIKSKRKSIPGWVECRGNFICVSLSVHLCFMYLHFVIVFVYFHFCNRVCVFVFVHCAGAGRYQGEGA